MGDKVLSTKVINKGCHQPPSRYSLLPDSYDPRREVRLANEPSVTAVTPLLLLQTKHTPHEARCARRLWVQMCQSVCAWWERVESKKVNTCSTDSHALGLFIVEFSLMRFDYSTKKSTPPGFHDTGEICEPTKVFRWPQHCTRSRASMLLVVYLRYLYPESCN